MPITLSMHIVQTIRIIIIFHAYSHAVVPWTGLLTGLIIFIKVYKNELDMFELLCTCSGHNNTDHKNEIYVI